MHITKRLTAMTADLPQPIAVGDLHRFAPDAQGRRRLSFTVAAGDRALAEVAVIPTHSGAPQEHIDSFAATLRGLLSGSEQRVADAESRVAGRSATIKHQRAEIGALQAKLSDFEKGFDLSYADGTSITSWMDYHRAWHHGFHGLARLKETMR